MLARVIAFVIPLSFDSLAVAIALGLGGIKPLRPALTFAAFETVMPIVGIVVGRFAGDRFAVPAEVLGVGIHAFREVLENEDETEGLSFSSLRSAAVAGIGISMDELAVGFPLGTARLPVGTLLTAIAAQAFAVTFCGILIGRRVGESLGRSASRISGAAAGVAFSALGIWLIVEALVAVGSRSALE